MNGVGNFQEKKIHPSRISTIDVSDLSLKKHHMKALIELDVTAARGLIREYKKMGKGLTFTAWIIKCISESMKENKSVNAYVNIKKRTVVTFEDIDITVMVEKKIGGEDVPLPYVIRKTSEKSMEEIHEEIKAAKARELTGEDFVFERNISPLLLKIGLSLPQFIRKFFWRKMMGDPFFAKKIMGTAAVTSVGMCGQLNGWVIPASLYTLCFALGSINKRPVIIEGRIVEREYLKMTVLADHDVIDGAPAARFISHLAGLIESAHGLNREADKG